ncbi:MAG: hypothetical protein D4R82_05640 [Dehalococcoidia bacterium]|nr:MAG: hypothetical protein D4R82_05640 [Dehalococcoidia bacterium]
MAVKDSTEWLEELKSQKPIMYVDGEKLEKPYEDPRILPYAKGHAGIRTELSSPLYREMGSIVTSPLINEEVNLFANIHEGPEQWINRTRIQRVINRRRLCVFRCLQEDTSNAYWAFTYELDQAHNTEYHKRFTEWVKHMQKTDNLCAGAIMDARGDRTKPPHEQPDAFVRVVEREKRGIVIRGSKTSVSMACAVNELFITPSPISGRYTPTAEDKDFAVACAVPVDSEGIVMIGKLPTKRERKTDLRMDYPFGRAGVGDPVFLTVFDNVFVPWERVFLCGEWDMLERGASLGIGTHFSAKGGCKAGLLDLMIGAAALAAEYNGLENTPHARQKLSILMSWAEEAYAAAIGAEVEGGKHSSGVWLPDIVKSSANKWLCSEHGGDDLDILLDLGGGLVTNAPEEMQWNSSEVRAYLDKYLVGKKDYSAIDRVRVMKLVEDMAASDMAGLFHQASVNTGGDLMAARSLVYSFFDLEDRKLTAKVVAGLAEKDNIGFTWHR